ncbi:HNH endonuclease [Ectopseudomonas mendocina]|nr:HNH endonuclease [Pseudomonas mendocina]
MPIEGAAREAQGQTHHASAAIGKRQRHRFHRQPFPRGDDGKPTSRSNTMIELGKKGRDKITGFEGVITGRAQYLILQRKIRADGPPHRRWQSVHEIIWEEHNGPRPAGHLVVFKDGNRRNFSPDNLELITRAENCRRNSIHRYPPELKQAIRRLKKLKRTIEEKSNEEPARPD